ncbi:MAG: phosphatase PAP2 family protein [Firmicutes bacterium]|nr:phosphatase PAP2 family protein [Bacillota bacterium]
MTNNRLPIPKYGIVPAAFYILAIPLYFITHLIASNLPHHNASLPLDSSIPFVASFIWIYVLAYLQWFVGYVALARSDESICKKYFGGELIAKILCAIIFILIPTTMVRPEICACDASSNLVRWMYTIDSPDNLLPSIHCMESWLVARGLAKTNAPKPAKIIMWAFTILVCLSVVFVKQHVVVDIAAGILVAELGLYLGNKVRIRNLYDSVENKLGIR